MSDLQILTSVVAAAAFVIGYGLGHLRGQYVALKWCNDLDKQFRRIGGLIRP